MNENEEKLGSLPNLFFTPEEKAENIGRTSLCC